MISKSSTLPVFGVLGACAVVMLGADPPWEAKPMQDWTQEDSRRILTDSPWAKIATATVSPLQTEDQRREGGNMGQEHGIGFDGLADDRPRAQIPKSLADIVKPEKAPVPRDQSLKLQLRWEGALPVRVAELKAGVVEPPSLTDGHYCIAVYGVPLSRVKGDPRTLGEPLRKMAVLRRAGKKDVTPTSVEVFQREDGMVIVYAFPYSAEITKNDERIDFEARIGRIGIVQSFVLQEMRFHGNLEM